tara:strand:- start:6701 stop:6937 length:237 start_codon:yes stop_codon:yes gene_type:complete
MYYSYQKKTISYLIFNDIFITAPSGLSDICSIYSIGVLIINLVSDGLLEEFENYFTPFTISNADLFVKFMLTSSHYII